MHTVEYIYVNDWIFSEKGQCHEKVCRFLIRGVTLALIQSPRPIGQLLYICNP